MDPTVQLPDEQPPLPRCSLTCRIRFLSLLCGTRLGAATWAAQGSSSSGQDHCLHEVSLPGGAVV